MHFHGPRSQALGDSRRIAQDLRQEHRVRGPISRFLWSALVVVASAVFPSVSRADIVYTWHEDDGQNVTAQLDVKSTVLAAGQINMADVVSFSFIGTFSSDSFNFDAADIATDEPNFPISISKVTGIPTDSHFFLIIADPNYGQFDGQATIDFNSSLTTPSGQNWDRSVSAIGIQQQGVGHWTVALAVPEPSSLVLAGIGAATVALAAVAGRNRRPQTATRAETAGSPFVAAESNARPLGSPPAHPRPRTRARLRPRQRSAHLRMLPDCLRICRQRISGVRSIIIVRVEDVSRPVRFRSQLSH